MLVREMVEIYSPTGSEGNLVDFLIEWAKKRGFNAYKDQVGNFIGEKGTGKEILLVGHVDTVPGETPVKMEEKKLYGRGVVDAKGPLACFLEAAAATATGKLIVIGAVDEEGNSKGARHILEKFSPSYIIVGEPSGWSNVTIGYKGNVNLFYTNEKSKEHSSSCNLNCCEETVDFFNTLNNFCNSFNQEKTLFSQLGIKLLSITSEDDGLTERTRMTLNLRIPTEFDLGELKAVVEKARGRASVTYSSYEEPVKVTKRSELVSVFIGAIRSLGGDVRFKLKAGTSDMNILQQYRVPMVTYGPGDSRLDHTPHEHLDLDEYEKAVHVVRTVLETLASR